MVTGLKEWKFGMTNDYLVELVLSGKKKATTSVYNGEVPKIGEESIILFENNDITYDDWKTMKKAIKEALEEEIEAVVEDSCEETWEECWDDSNEMTTGGEDL